MHFTFQRKNAKKKLEDGQLEKIWNEFFRQLQSTLLNQEEEETDEDEHPCKLERLRQSIDTFARPTDNGNSLMTLAAGIYFLKHHGGRDLQPNLDHFLSLYHPGVTSEELVKQHTGEMFYYLFYHLSLPFPFTYL